MKYKMFTNVLSCIFIIHIVRENNECKTRFTCEKKWELVFEMFFAYLLITVYSNAYQAHAGLQGDDTGIH